MKYIFQITVISILLITSSCSILPPSEKNPFKEGFNDAFKQVNYSISSTTTSWKKTEIDQGAQKQTQLLLSANSFIKVAVQTYNGIFPNENTAGDGPITYSRYNNEIVNKISLEGDLVIVNNFKLTEPNYTTFTTQDITTKIKNKGFDTIYELTTSTEKIWESLKVGGSGIWRGESVLYTEYFLVKKSSNKLQMIAVSYDKTLDEYQTYGPLDDTVLNNPSLSYHL
ncbi:MAG: hypothetical protein KFW21_04295 [Spirochaetota bacterium]|nr:hypothetical protein [Spirochaetota bacterium]